MYNLQIDSTMWWDIHCTVTIAKHCMSTFTNCNCNEWCFLLWLPGRLISDCNKTFQFGKSVAQNEHWIPVKVLGNKVNSYWSTVSSTVAFTYIILIFKVHISSLFNEKFHCVHMAPISCPVEGRHLMGRKNMVHYDCLVYSWLPYWRWQAPQ